MPLFTEVLSYSNLNTIVQSKYGTNNAQFFPGVATVASFEIYVQAVLAKLCGYQTHILQMHCWYKSQCVCQWCLPAIIPTQETYKCWSVHSPDCALFGSLLSGAGPVIGQLLDDIIPMLTSCLSPDTDPEMRLRYVLNGGFVSATLQWGLQCIQCCMYT